MIAIHPAGGFDFAGPSAGLNKAGALTEAPRTDRLAGPKS